MKKNTTYTTYEVCPHCEAEVELNAELAVQTCPNCGKRIVTCSMCRACDANDGKSYCANCCLCYQAEAENLEAVAYQAEKKALVDSALASIRENGPFTADAESAPVVPLVYVGEKGDEMILEVYIEEAYEEGQEESVAVHTLADGDDRYFDLVEFSNDEIRAILRATGIVRDDLGSRLERLLQDVPADDLGAQVIFLSADETPAGEPVYATRLQDGAVLVHYSTSPIGDWSRAVVIPSGEFENGRASEALDWFLSE